MSSVETNNFCNSQFKKYFFIDYTAKRFIQVGLSTNHTVLAVDELKCFKYYENNRYCMNSKYTYHLTIWTYNLPLTSAHVLNSLYREDDSVQCVGYKTVAYKATCLRRENIQYRYSRHVFGLFTNCRRVLICLVEGWYIYDECSG